MSAPQSSSPVAPSTNKLRWLPYVIGAATFVLVLASVGLVAGDWFLRNAEMRGLVVAIENSEATMSETQDSVSAVFDAYGGLDNPVPADRQKLVTELADIAGYAQLSIAGAGEQVAAVPVMPWHTSIRTAQDAYLTHNLAWQRYMEAAAKDPIEFTSPQADVNDTFKAVEPALTEAIPQPALFDLVNRVAQIFVDGYPDPEATTNGPTQDASFHSGDFASLLGHQIFLPMS